jgi:DNA (cytosine-5)-methyltransferase 1
LNVLDLFSGIGGFSLGLERAGMNTVAFCEVCQDAQNVLRKHWPETKIFDDVRQLNARAIESAGIKRVDVIAGGFPCQDISVAGKQAGLEGDRSSLWKEYARLIGELKPRFVIIENVAALRSNGLGTVLQDLWAVGYDAEWHVIPASAVGLPHQRERLWVIAYPSSERLQKPILESYAYAFRASPEKPRFGDNWLCERVTSWARSKPVQVDDGVSGKLASSALRQYGNSVVPQIPEIIGRAILAV